jgi:hypothetical protein
MRNIRHFRKLSAGLSVGLALMLSSALHAQDLLPKQAACGTDENYAAAVKNNPVLLQTQKEMDARAGVHAFMKDEDTSLLIIPIVFHVVHENGPENISKQRILDVVQTMNEAYRRRNKDTSLIRDIFKNLPTDAHIEFRLATRDPWGNCSEGIDRIASNLSDQADDRVKAVSWWDNSRYLNVWVVKSINSAAVQNGIIAGYAQFPWDAVYRSSTDGIIMDYNFIKKGDKTLAHEAGHYLGLYHTFQDACSEDQGLQGDHVLDTPPAAAANFGWNPSVNSCHSDSPDLPDMIENYMDYADHKYLFTPRQVQRMRSFLKGARSSLLLPKNQEYTIGSCGTAVSGIEEEKVNITASLNVYPNPASSSFRVAIEANANQQGRLEIRDITGKIMTIQPQLNIQEGHQELEFSTDALHLSKGIYVLQLQAGNSVIRKKFVVE